jgi:hypothetical protein
MNYACVYLVAVLAFSLVYWYIRGRAVYTGPVTEAVADDLSSEHDIVTADKVNKGTTV